MSAKINILTFATMQNSEMPMLMWPLNTQAILGQDSYSCLSKEKLEEAELCAMLSLGLFMLRASTAPQSIKFSFADPY